MIVVTKEKKKRKKKKKERKKKKKNAPTVCCLGYVCMYFCFAVHMIVLFFMSSDVFLFHMKNAEVGMYLLRGIYDFFF